MRLRYAERGSERRLRRGRAEAHEHIRLHDVELSEEPWPTGFDLAAVRRLVDSALAGTRVLEVLDDVRDPDAFTRDLGIRERLIEQRPRRPHERAALQILPVAGLFSNEHEAGAARAVAEDALRGLAIEIASPAPVDRRLEPAEARRVGNEGRGAGAPGGLDGLRTGFAMADRGMPSVSAIGTPADAGMRLASPETRRTSWKRRRKIDGCFDALAAGIPSSSPCRIAHTARVAASRFLVPNGSTSAGVS